MARTKTGGGKGTNQYQIKGTAKTPAATTNLTTDAGTFAPVAAANPFPEQPVKARPDPYASIRAAMRNDPLFPAYVSGDLPDRAATVILDQAEDVFAEHEKWPLNCGEVSATWKQRLERAGVPCAYVSGDFVGGLDPATRDTNDVPGSREHVWLEVDGHIFDPTASQFAGDVDQFLPEHYQGGPDPYNDDMWMRPGYNVPSMAAEPYAFDDVGGGLGEAADYIREAVGFDPDGPPEPLDPNDLIASQSWVQESSVRWHQTNQQDPEPIQVVEYAGSLYIWDGTNRAEAALRDGRPVLAEVMAFDW